MADPFIAEIRIFGFNFAPKGWATCDGQLMAISQNTALFSLLGTTYGGDGKTTFALPDLAGSAPMHSDDNQFPLGAAGGQSTVTLQTIEMAAHTHTVMGSNQPGNQLGPDPTMVLARSGGATAYQSNSSANIVQMDPANAVGLTGGSQPHNNMQPYLSFLFCIALQGVFPPRT